MKQISKRLASGVLCIAMAFCLLAANANAANVGFTDVPANHWAKPYIEAAAAKGFVSGVGGNQFAPDKPVSYVEFTVMVTRAFLPDTVDKFANKTDAWYSPYMWAGLTTSIIDSDMDVWDPGNWDTAGMQPITRYDMAAMIANTAGGQFGALSDIDTNGLEDSISDWNSIPEDYRWDILLCYGAGILSGTDSSGKFSGNATMTRAQACTVLIRMDEVINGTDYGIDKPSDNTNSGNQNNNNQGTSSSGYTAESILAKLETLKAKYPEDSVYDIYNSTIGDIYDGKTQTYSPNVNNVLSCYRPNVKPGNYGRFYDCAAWAWYVSDYVFGNAPIIRTHSNWDEIKVGDVVEEGDSYHWGFVIEKGVSSFDGAEYIKYTDANGYHHTVHWTVTCYKTSLTDPTSTSKFTVYSRY